MSLFPLSPRFAKILIMETNKNVFSYIIAIVSALSVGDPFIGENELVGNMNDEARRGLEQNSITHVHYSQSWMRLVIV